MRGKDKFDFIQSLIPLLPAVFDNLYYLAKSLTERERLISEEVSVSFPDIFIFLWELFLLKGLECALSGKR